VSALGAFRYLRLPVVELMQRYLEYRAPFRLPGEVVYGVVLFFGVGGAPDGLMTAALACTHPTNWRSILMKMGFTCKEKLTIKGLKPNALIPFQ
jgi:hypothetical protein